MVQVKKKKKARAAERNGAGREQERYFNRAVAKAFSVLHLLAKAEEPLSLSRIAAEIELTKSSASRILYTLQALRYLTQDAEGHYGLAEKNKQNGYHSVAGLVVPLAQETMQALHQRFKETVSMAVLMTNHMEVACVMESPHIVRMANTVGRILPPHASSLGKAITAFQPESIAKKLIVSYGLHVLTPNTIADELSLAKEMQRIREQGYAFEMEESVPNGCCFGCPVFLDKTSAVASISISMPKVRLPEAEERRALTEALKAGGQEVSKRLRHALRQGE